ncbi:glycoside hydrolase [Xylanibacter muris]|uniref:Endo-1,4-beta-xylanase xyn5A n=1 Tax=Xylanibacter muris TaxID=2736290 RepID=A0ABX2ASH1_9BACT|nr:glycosyl hydrolase [Xylanibacter muris]NPD92977.1 endo-1,4-beta-xylanase xyn5A [Xylanibacter muris]
MKRLLISLLTASAALLQTGAAVITVTVNDTRHQYITGFGAAACWGAMAPIQDVNVIKLLYGEDSPVGLNIVRMEISPNMIGNVTTPWDTPYDWHGYLPVIKEAKKRGAIIFGTPWSPPGDYKTNGIAGGGNSEEQGYQRGELKPSAYSKFFPWLNSFLAYMKKNDAAVDIVSLQNEPDWWVNYSGCLYTPQQLHDLVKSYASRLDRKTYGVRLMNAEPLGFNPEYSDIMLDDPETAKHIDIIAGHIYGHVPLGNMAKAAKKALAMGKEVWMTEHSVNPRGDADNSVIDLPTWHEEILFAEEVNECLLAGGNAYVYWYMLAHWSFVGSGDKTIQPGNEYGKLLRRGYIMSHFSKNLTGSTRIDLNTNIYIGTNSAFQASAFIKGDSIIVMGIDTTANVHTMKVRLPYKVKACEWISSTEGNVYNKTAIDVDGPVKEISVPLPARSINTYIFTIDRTADGITDLPYDEEKPQDDAFYDMYGRKVNEDALQRHGIYIHNGKKIVY